MTKASNTRPTRRILTAPKHDRPFVVELMAEAIIIRPKGARRGGPAEVVILPGAAYVRGLWERKAATRRTRKGGRR